MKEKEKKNVKIREQQPDHNDRLNEQILGLKRTDQQWNTLSDSNARSSGHQSAKHTNPKIISETFGELAFVFYFAGHRAKLCSSRELL